MPENNNEDDNNAAIPIMPARTMDGFLLDRGTWQPAIAELIAAEENISLSLSHWEIIYYLRAFYAEYNMSPSIRTLLNGLKAKYPEKNINSIYLQQLFPSSPAQQANKIAGLPKPIRCI